MSKDLQETAGTTELSAAMAGLSEQEKSKLKEYGKAITSITRAAEASLNRARVNVGHELLNVRAIITNDKNFGIWARWNTPFDSSSVWNPLMHIAQAELDGILTDDMLRNSNPAVLAKVIRLPEETRKDLLAQIEAGEKVKRSDVPSVAQAEASESGESRPAEVTGTEGDYDCGREKTAVEEAKDQVKKDKKKAPSATEVVERAAADWAHVIGLTFIERFNMMKELVGIAEQIELAFALLGLDTDPQIILNEDILEYIVQSLIEHECDSKGEEMQVKNAAKVINDARADW